MSLLSSSVTAPSKALHGTTPWFLAFHMHRLATPEVEAAAMHTGNHCWAEFTGRSSSGPRGAPPTLLEPCNSQEWPPVGPRQGLIGQFTIRTLIRARPTPAPPPPQSIPAGLPSPHKDKRGQVGVITSRRGNRAQRRPQRKMEKSQLNYCFSRTRSDLLM